MTIYLTKAAFANSKVRQPTKRDKRELLRIFRTLGSRKNEACAFLRLQKEVSA